MDSRKVIKVHNSYYINIPSEISEALGIVKGDRLKVIHLPGNGILITLDEGAGRVSVNLQNIDRLQRAADAIYTQYERKMKEWNLNFLSNLHARIISDLAVSGLLDLKARVQDLETKQQVSNQGRAKIHLLKKPKPNDP